MTLHEDARVRVEAPVLAALLGFLAAVSSCAAPPVEDPPDVATAVDALERRTDASALDSALERLALDESTLTLPSPATCTDPTSGAYWLAHALAWSPAVRMASRRARAAIAETDGAGAPGPIDFEVANEDFGSANDRVEGELLFDVLGLLGVGRSRAERRRLDAEATLAVVELEATVWQSWIDVETARIRLLAAVQRRQRLEALVEQASADLVRVEALFESGWIGESPTGAARAAVAATNSMRSVSAENVTASRAAFVQLVGTRHLDDSLDELVGGAHATLASVFLPDATVGSDGLDRHPELKALRVAFLLREAEVRSIAASAWPSIGLGPRVGYEDDLAIGAVLRLELPFPSSWRGRLAAAVERRDAVVEAYEDRVHSLLARAESARARLDEIAARRRNITTAVVEGSAVGWQGARASFRVGRLGVVEWVDALNRRRDALTVDVDAAEADALAVIELAASRGPATTRVPWEHVAALEVQQ